MVKIKYAIIVLWLKCRSFGFNTFKSLRKNWLLSLTMLLLSVTVAIYFGGYSSKFIEICEVIVKILTPFSIIIGIVLGYPLLKRKLAEKYVTKQFDLMINSNNTVRRKCLDLMGKYQIKKGSKILEPSYINDALNDVIDLRHDAIDANPEVYKYVDLLFRSIQKINESYSHYKEKDFPQFIYQETFSFWLNSQFNAVFDCSKYVGVIPTGETSIRPRLNVRLSKYVSENKVCVFNGLDTSINHFHTSALLVTFYGVNNRCLSEYCDIIFGACYEAVPSPSPLARLLFNSEIYFPPILLTPTKLLTDYGKLCLVGFKRKIKTKFGNENTFTKSYYVLIYTNISDISFVYGTIHNIDDIKEYKDGYLGCSFSIEDVYDFQKSGEYISFCIDTDKLSAYYKAVESELKKKFITENAKH